VSAYDFSDWEAALVSPASNVEMWKLMRGRLDSGRTRDQLIYELTQLAMRFRSEGRESEEDQVLDAWDICY
jgi:hypothetical protein